MKRTYRSLAVSAVLAVMVAAGVFVSALPVAAQEVSAHRTAALKPERLWMRSTSAASVVVNTNWNAPKGASGFVDSLVFRRGATTRTVYDTSGAYPTAHFAFPPNVGRGIPAALQDSILPWIVLKWSQDTTSYAFAGTSGGVTDSVRFGIEYSEDGVNWFSCSGTPTYRFDTVFFTSGQDGLQNPSLVGVEVSPGQDAAQVPLKCRVSTFNGTAIINNLTSCMAGTLMRVIVGGAYSGQYKIEALTWVED